MLESRCSVLFVGTVVCGRGTSWCGRPVGRRSCFDPCTPGWFNVGRLRCGLLTVRMRLQLRCGWCAVVLAASWLAWLAWVPSRCRRWSYSRMLFVYAARPFCCWLVASWFVQVQCSAVCYCWLVGCVMAESRCSVLFVRMVVGGRGTPWCGQPVGRRSRFDPCTPGWFNVGPLACGLLTGRSRLQLRCGRCAVVLAASWSAWLAWVPSRCCRWSYVRMLFV